ncbi:MAG: Kelch repeat-containing protein [Kiritimatiellia bacterium]
MKRTIFSLSTTLYLTAVFSAFSNAAWGRLDPTTLPSNTWIELGQSNYPPQAFCSIWYADITDEFLVWGKVGGHRTESKQYEVQTLSLTDPQPGWRDSFPHGKESTWKGGKFPNWGCGCHSLNYTPDRPWLSNVRDRWVANSADINIVSFVETDGVKRPTRVPTFHQGAYDSMRHRLVYYAGGKTFLYDPKSRIWTDLNAIPPLACEALVWATMAYDPEGDQMVLFGGGYALNPWGGAQTWLFDCARNVWHRPQLKGNIEPPLRCNTQLVYDSKNKKMVLLGGDAQDRFLADTWVFDPATLTWEERKPEKCPPPIDRCAACFVKEHGLVFMMTASGYTGEPGKKGGCAWTYDVAENRWTPLKGRLPVARMEWVSCAYSSRDHVIVATAHGVGTWLYRLDPATATDDDPQRVAVAPDIWVWNSRARGQVESILGAPPPDRTATEKMLTELPCNTPVVVDYPGYLISKTWSSATIDTHRGVVLYTGGGHSGYKGNDIAMYDVGINRWSFDSPPRFMPTLYNYNAALFGWCYRMWPQSQHTYRWYAYDPVSRTMVYCARPAGPFNGQTVLLEDDPHKAFVYDAKKHGNWTWVYDPEKNKHYPPAFGRPFGNPWALALVGTPYGIYAKADKELYRGTVTVTNSQAEVNWQLVEKNCPAGNGEFQPVVYDSKRDRLVFLAPDNTGVVSAYERKLSDGEWRKLETSGPTRSSREAVYDTVNDCIISMPEQSLMVLDFKNNRWRELDVTMPKGSYGTECALVYDPIHKVCVALIPKSFTGKMQVVLFRYDPSTAQYRP